MKTPQGVGLVSLIDQHQKGDLLGYATVAFFRDGRIDTIYTEYIENHPATAHGYLASLCMDLLSMLHK